jgi:hypothetical protein
MKDFPVKKVLLVLGIGLAAYVLYSVYKVFAAGERTIAGLLMAPFTLGSEAASAVWGGAQDVGNNVIAAASIPGLTQRSQQLDTQITSQNNQDYAPGGKIYTNILNSQGKVAADKAWATVQSHDATMTAQTGSAWNPLNWF